MYIQDLTCSSQTQCTVGRQSLLCPLVQELNWDSDRWLWFTGGHTELINSRVGDKSTQAPSYKREKGNTKWPCWDDSMQHFINSIDTFWSPAKYQAVFQVLGMEQWTSRGFLHGADGKNLWSLHILITLQNPLPEVTWPWAKLCEIRLN